MFQFVLLIDKICSNVSTADITGKLMPWCQLKTSPCSVELKVYQDWSDVPVIRFSNGMHSS